jgi:hypothetical protein
MGESTFSEYWDKAQFCYFRAEAAKGPAAKHLWIQLAQDWIALAESSMPQSAPQIDYRPKNQLESLEQLEPFLVA